MRMAAVGMGEHLIAFMVGMPLDELEAEFGDEMKRAAVTAQLAVSETLLAMATSGKHLGATIYWLKHCGVEKKDLAGKKVEEKKSKYCTVIPPPLKVRGPDGTLYD